MAWWDLDAGMFGLGGSGGGGGWSGGSFSWPSSSGAGLGMDPSWFKFDLGQYGDGFNWGGAGNAAGATGGGFKFPEWVPGALEIGKFGLGAGLGIKSMMDNASYQRAQRDYIRSRQAQEKEYNDAVLAYQKQRQAWEGEMMGMFGESMGAMGEGMGAFQEQIQSILGEQIAAAKPLLEQSKELLEPAVAALAKGEVPEVFAPVLDQAKARARAAAVQAFESAGIDSGTAMASIEGQIDQQAQGMLLAAAVQMLTGGQGLAATGGGFLQSAVGTAQAGMAPIMAEFQMMVQALGALFGGFPGLTPGTPPAPPTA